MSKIFAFLSATAMTVLSVSAAHAGETLAVNLVAVNSSNRIPLIQNGTIDIECGGTSSSKKRLEQVMFSVSTFASQPAWLTMSASGLKSAADIKGKTVVVTQGSNAVAIAQGISQKDDLGLNVVQARDHAESFLMLTSGRAAAFMEDDILLAGLKAQYAKPDDLSFLSDQYDKTYYGLMFSKDDPEFKQTVDGVLSKLMASGDFNKIYDKWFVSPIPPKHINLNFPLNHGGQRRNGWVRCADPQPVAEIVPERQAELLACLRKAQHAISRLQPVVADRASGNLALDDKAAQIPLRRIGVERGFEPLKNPQQFRLAAPQPKQQSVEIVIAGSDGENAVEANLQTQGCTGIRPSPIGFQRLVEVPDQIPQGFDVLHLTGCGRHQLERSKNWLFGVRCLVFQ
nr:amino acid ABC transporter substrate-binding protein [uncultured Paracoccus sp.]